MGMKEEEQKNIRRQRAQRNSRRGNISIEDIRI
jgi:hypothetical protein